MSAARVRVAVGAAGALAMAWGAWLVLSGGRATDPVGVATWLAGVVVVHDLVLAPAVVVLGVVALRPLRAGQRALVQGPFVVCAAVAVTSAPLWLGRLLHRLPTANPTVDPWDYPRNLLVVLGVVVVAAAGVAAVRPRLPSDRRARKVRPSRDHRSSTR